MVTIVDTGLGNAGSIVNMLRYLGIDSERTADPGQIGKATRLILPGVGSFDHGMSSLDRPGLIASLESAVMEKGRPILGICLGMQMLAEGSDEGDRTGLGWIAGRSIRFDFGDNPEGLRVPHMGWNEVRIPRAGRLFPDTAAGHDDETRFYFVHSYHLSCADPEDVAAVADYGMAFTAAVERGNVYGVQFHPEKSHRFGMAVLQNLPRLKSDEDQSHSLSVVVRWRPVQDDEVSKAGLCGRPDQHRAHLQHQRSG